MGTACWSAFRLTSRLQSVLNAAARLIYRLSTRNHITEVLISLHWLWLLERIQFKLAVLAYKVLHGDAPRYLGLLTRVDDLPGRRTLRSNNANRVVVAYRPSNCQQSAAAPLQSRLPTFGIHCQLKHTHTHTHTHTRLTALFLVFAGEPVQER